jgi:glycosyltransferase involved in cell wall biosynthesis
LSQDVLFLRNLPLQQLAACYRLARLAVNPSLSEGGFPFTFTEALSVGTPVVMARIPVTEGVVTDPDLQSMMLFDPYDWQDMAKRIEWALENGATLLSKQRSLYDRLAQRTWRHVVDDHIEILDRIAAEEDGAAEKT